MGKEAKLAGWDQPLLVLIVSIIQVFFCISSGIAAESGSCLTDQTLPMTGARIVSVASESALQNAMAGLQSGDTILLADGVYNLTSTLYVNGRDNVTIRGASGCSGVVLAGKGMDNPSYGNVEVGIWSNSRNTVIAHLTIRDTFDNTVIFNGGAQSPRIYSVNLIDSGSQFIKANPTDASNGVGVDNGIVEYCRIEYTNTPPASPSHSGGSGYFNGISAHTADNWTIRNNLFKNLHNHDSSSYWWNPAVLFWNHSQSTITESNTFIDCDRAIAYGLTVKDEPDHSGGIIRNNFTYIAPGLFSSARKADSDAQIIVWDSPSTKVLHNTVMTNGNTNLSIEFRFGTSGGEARNNLADAPIGTRGGGTYTESGNYLNAVTAMFREPGVGDLHLLNNATTRDHVIDKVATLVDASTDFDGDQRPVEALADIGADELSAPLPVRVAGTPPAYYPTIAEAYGHTDPEGTIEATEHLFEEDVTLGRPIAVALQGGYDESYTEKSGLTAIKGSLTVKLGSLTVADVEVR
jgi:hypothetical protein